MKIVKVIVFISLLISNLIFAQWTKVDMDTISWSIPNAIDACDSDCVVISVNFGFPRYSGVFQTTDGGNSWADITPLELFSSIVVDLSMINKENIWLTSTSNDSAKILYSSDGGKTWFVQFNDPSKTTFFNYIEMFDLQNGIAMGDPLSISDSALFLRTNDGGNNWNIMKNNHPIYASGDTWRMLDFVTANVGYFSENWYGKENQGITKTTDGGDSWNLILTDVGVDVINFYDENIGLAFHTNFISPSVYERIIWRTIDGGDNWEDFEFPLDVGGEDIEFLKNHPSKVWAATSNGLFYSSDTGSTWIEQNVPTSSSHLHGRDIVFVSDMYGWFIAEDSELFYTNNNGGLITEVEELKDRIIPTKFILDQNYPNPFNPTTTINYSVPNTETNGSTSVQIIVIDVLGNEVAVLVNEEKQAGSYEIEFDGSDLSSGIYYYTLKSSKFRETKKMILIK